MHSHNSLLTIFLDKRAVCGVDGKDDAHRRRRRSGRFLLEQPANARKRDVERISVLNSTPQTFHQ
jgi:hypothetical protein